GGKELPAEQDEKHQPELEDQVRARELEQDRVGEGRAFAKQAATDRDRGIGAARARGPEQGGERDPAEVVPAQDPGDRLPGDERLDHGGDQKAEDERPEDLPEHEKGHLERFPDCVDDARHWRIYTRHRCTYVSSSSRCCCSWPLSAPTR